MDQISSPETFDPATAVFADYNSMRLQAAFDPNQQSPPQTQTRLQVPQQEYISFAPQSFSQGYHQAGRAAGSYPASPSWLHNRQQQHVLHQYGSPYAHAYGVRHHPFALQHALNTKSNAETKARLDKKHVEILEREFTKNQKPSSIIKRELAEQMGHEVARINNWFQNRRAKEKSNRRTAEYAAREEAAQRESTEGTTSQSPEDQGQGEREDSATLGDYQRPVLSSARIGDADEEEEKDVSEGQRSFKSETDEAAHIPLPALDEDTESTPYSDTDDFGVVDRYPHSPPSSIDIQQQQQFELESPSSNVTHPFEYQGLENFYSLAPTPLNDLRSVTPQDMETAWFHGLPQAHPPTDYFGSCMQPMALLNAPAPMAMAHAEQEQQCEMPMKEFVNVEQLSSPVSMSQTPPPARDLNQRFRSPRPINIAARRQQRPQALGLAAARRISNCGPKTGIDMPRRGAEDTTPMRRTASATGSIPRRMPRTAGPGPLSPRTMEQDMILSLQGMRSPSYKNSASPISPSRADTPATNSSSDEHNNMACTNFVAPLPTRFGDHAIINTPPVTPGLNLGFHGFNNWSYNPHEPPPLTPSLCSRGGSEVDFPGSSHIPSYVASQPATPGFPRDAFGPGFRFLGSGSHGAMSNVPEYHFPESYMMESSVASSPSGGQPGSKHFQFAQNVTPQDFSNEK